MGMELRRGDVRSGNRRRDRTGRWRPSGVARWQMRCSVMGPTMGGWRRRRLIRAVIHLAQRTGREALNQTGFAKNLLAVDFTTEKNDVQADLSRQRHTRKSIEIVFGFQADAKNGGGMGTGGRCLLTSSVTNSRPGTRDSRLSQARLKAVDCAVRRSDCTADGDAFGK